MGFGVDDSKGRDDKGRDHAFNLSSAPASDDVVQRWPKAKNQANGQSYPEQQAQEYGHAGVP